MKVVVDFNSVDTLQKIHIIALGGTIASRSTSITSEFYSHAQLEVSELLKNIPPLSEKIALSYEQFSQQTSQNMTMDQLVSLGKRIRELAASTEINSIIILQGTNAIEETSYFINLVIKTRKTIIFTGAMLPNNALGADGYRNIFNAIKLASSKQLEGMGVVLTFNDCILSARDAIKINPSIINDFSFNGKGLIGYITGDIIHIQMIPPYKHTYQSEFDIDKITVIPKVDIIFTYLGMDDKIVKSVIENQVQGIICAGMGKGYYPNSISDALSVASKKGAIVVRSCRSGNGIVNVDPETDHQNGYIAGGNLAVPKARMLLSVALNFTNNKMEIQRIFDQY